MFIISYLFTELMNTLGFVCLIDLIIVFSYYWELALYSGPHFDTVSTLSLEAPIFFLFLFLNLQNNRKVEQSIHPKHNENNEPDLMKLKLKNLF